MLLLFETAAGFALFKVLQEGKVTAAEPEVGRRMSATKEAALYFLCCGIDVTLVIVFAGLLQRL